MYVYNTMSTLRMGPNHTVEMCLCIGGFIVHLFVRDFNEMKYELFSSD